VFRALFLTAKYIGRDYKTFSTHAGNSCFSYFFFFPLIPQNLVEKFELIATTGKNAKMLLIPSFQSSIIPIIY